MTVVSLTYFLALLLPPAAVEDRPALATVSRPADFGAPDACRPSPRPGTGAGWLKRGVPPAPPSAVAAAVAVRPSWAAKAHRAPPPAPSGPRLLYLLMSLLC